jgi:hypothetical protein
VFSDLLPVSGEPAAEDRNQPELQVSELQADAWMAAAGLRPVERIDLFADKWFVVYGR